MNIGSAISITFDRLLTIAQMEPNHCEDILDVDSLQQLEISKCQWASKSQLVILPKKPIIESSIQLTLLPGTLKEDLQQIALENAAPVAIEVKKQHSTSTETPILFITGPREVPECGKFVLVGHFISAQMATYQWTVEKLESQPLEDALSKIESDVQTPYLSLNSEDLAEGVIYKFTLTATPVSGDPIAAKHNVVRLSYNAPVVTIYADTLLSHDTRVLSQGAVLTVKAVVPDCAASDKKVNFQWSLDNPKIKFDFKSMRLPVYEIDPYSLPAGEPVRFSVRAFIGPYWNESASAAVKFQVPQRELRAIISGASRRDIGWHHSALILDGTQSGEGHPPIVYQWRCHNKEGHPCYDYWNVTKDILIITTERRTLPKLQVQSNHFKPGHEYVMGLQVFDANNATARSNVDSVVVTVHRNHLPQINIESVVVGERSIPEDGTKPELYHVPAKAPVLVNASISTSYKLKNCMWSIHGHFRPLGGTSELKNEDGAKCLLAIEEGMLIENGMYRVTLSTCDRKGCNSANLTLHAVPGITSCSSEIDSYTEFEQVEVRVDSCLIPVDRAPVTYQLLQFRGNRMVPISAVEFSNIFTVIGPPLPFNETSQTLVIEVCDKYGFCTTFDADPVDVKAAENVTASLENVQELAEDAMQAGDFFQALILMNHLVGTEVDFPYGKALQVATQLQHLPVSGPSQLRTLYLGLAPLINSTEKNVRHKALSIFERVTQNAASIKSHLPLSVFKEAYAHLFERPAPSQVDSPLTKALWNAHATLVTCAASFIPLGQKLLLNGTHPYAPVTLLAHRFLSTEHHQVQTVTSTGHLETTVQFKEPVQKKFHNWDCGNGRRCSGVVVAISLYPESNPHPTSDVGRQVTPIITIKMHTPSTGKVVKGRTSPLGIAITVTRNGNITKESGMAMRCHNWNYKKNTWTMDDVQTMGFHGREAHCWGTQYSSFAVLEIHEGLTTAAVAGIAVACIMSALLFGMVILFSIRKKQHKEVRVSSEALRHGES